MSILRAITPMAYSATMSRFSYFCSIFGLILGLNGEYGASCALADEWVAYQKSGPIELFAEFQTDVPALLQQLKDVRAEFHLLLGLPKDDQNVQVILFSSSSSYRSYLRNDIPEALTRRAIFYRNGNTYQIYAYRHSDLVEDLRHEYTHALLHQNLPYIPLWIDEGLAEYLELPSAKRRSSARLTAMKWRCRSGWSPRLTSLENIRSASSMDSSDYRDSWAWMEFLLNDSAQSRQLLRDYLLAISAGEAPGNFSDWAAQRAPEVPRRVGSYFRRFRFSLR